MKRTANLIVVFLLSAVLAAAQLVTGDPIIAEDGVARDLANWSSGTSVPGTCAVGDFFEDTDALRGSRFLYCGETNVWTPVDNVVRDRKAIWNLPDPVAGDDGDYQIEFPAACTLQEVACNIQGGTSLAIDLYERARATPESGTTGMLTAPLSCDTDGAVTTSFTDAALAADVPLALGVGTPSGTPTLLRVHVKCRTD